MSGLFKSIGKVFKKVAKVAKKVALPALAIGAIVVTGGAALGLLPGITGLGGLAASLGASPALAGILSSAATGATIGGIGGLVTGQGFMKGATTGLVAGAAMGGINAAMGGFSAASTAATAATGAPSGGIGGAVSGAAVPGIPAAGVPAASSLVPQGPIAAGTGIGQAASGARTGIMGFLNKNPLMAGEVMKGIGGALTARSQGKERDRVYRDRRDSYDTGPWLTYEPEEMPSQSANDRFNGPAFNATATGYEYDPSTGRVRAKQGA